MPNAPNIYFIANFSPDKKISLQDHKVIYDVEATIFMELMISSYLSDKIKHALNGYEPDVFSAMYRIRDNIIESLDEGIIATDNHGKIQFVNCAEEQMLGDKLPSFRFDISMRASNHDFTNKLHVILGLIQMEMYTEAEAYIPNITVVQREMICRIMKIIDEPALAALLIGKLSRAADQNVRLILREIT